MRFKAKEKGKSLKIYGMMERSLSAKRDETNNTTILSRWDNIQSI
jgi:hypothetical protein